LGFDGSLSSAYAIKADAGGMYDVDFIRHEVQAETRYLRYNPNSNTVDILFETPHRSDHIYTDPGQDLLNEYCTDCPQTSSLADRLIFAFLIKPLNFVFELFSESADATIGVHQVSIDLTDSVKMGGNAIGSVQINNTGSITTNFTVICHTSFGSLIYGDDDEKLNRIIENAFVLEKTEDTIDLSLIKLYYHRQHGEAAQEIPWKT